MSSEAAKKAYPKDERIRDVLTQWSIARQQEAFDRGAVEALRQAANIAERMGGYISVGQCERMADEWVVGQ